MEKYLGRDQAGVCRNCYAELSCNHYENCPSHLTPHLYVGSSGSTETASADSLQVGGDHYKSMAMQPWDVMQAVLTHDEFVGFLKGNIIKYSMRAGKKAGAHDDSKKARHYALKLQEVQS